jgi:tRNA nucleotidyltransferase/poly(A) polymerase
MTPEEAMLRLLAESALAVGMGWHSYIVGGAVRDYAMGMSVKDLDVVVEPVEGRTTILLAEEVAKRLHVGCHPDQYGVVHLGPVSEDISFHGISLKGQKVEIVTSRKEKYDKSKKDSHKPSEVAVGTILEDLERRDFTINTLMWRLGDLVEGPESAPIIDLLGKGLYDLQEKILRTPLHPEETFDEDPSRILRGIRFWAKYDLRPSADTWLAFKSKAEELRRLPYEVVAMVFIEKILTLPKVQLELALDSMHHLGLLEIVFMVVPQGRMRRGINSTVKDTRMLLKLMNFSSPLMVGHSLSNEEYRLLQEYSWVHTDAELDAHYQKFLKPPFDALKFINDTGLSGPAISETVARARLMVLKNPAITAEVLQQTITAECAP